MSPIDIPDRNLLGIFGPSVLKVEATEEEIIERAFSQPIGSPPLSQILEGCKNVLILVDDHTRTTPVKKILPRLLRELEMAGIQSSRIKILIALGTHRSMTEEEIIKKFGEDIPKRYPIFNHQWWDPSHLVKHGETFMVIRLRVNNNKTIVGIITHFFYITQLNPQEMYHGKIIRSLNNIEVCD